MAGQTCLQEIHLIGENLPRRKNEMLPAAWCVGDEQQLHAVRFLRPSPALALIAAPTRGDDIAPAVRTTLHPWNYVIAAQFPGRELHAAVGAGVVIAPE